MPNRKEHNKFCEAKGIDPKICDKVNRWMDRPSLKYGPAHRRYRHNPDDCRELARKELQKALKRGENLLEALKRAGDHRRACMAHIYLDKEKEFRGFINFPFRFLF